MKKRDFTVFLMLCLFWGISVNAIKMGLNEGLPVFIFAALRFLIGGFLIFLFIYIKNRKGAQKSFIESIKVKKNDLSKILFLSLFMFIISYILIYNGMRYLPSAVAGILNTTQVLITFILGYMILKEDNLTFSKITGLIIGILGVVLLVLSKNKNIELKSNTNFLKGFFIYICGCGSFSIASILAKKLRIHAKIEISTMYQTIFGAIALFFISIFSENINNLYLTFKGWVSLFYLAIFGTAIPFILYYEMINRLGPSILSTIQLVIPFVSTTFGYTILNEQLNILTILSGIIILTGVAFVIYEKRITKKYLL